MSHDDIRAALVRDHQRGGRFPADPELQHKAADWLAELLAEVDALTTRAEAAEQASRPSRKSRTEQHCTGGVVMSFRTGDLQFALYTDNSTAVEVRLGSQTMKLPMLQVELLAGWLKRAAETMKELAK